MTASLVLGGNGFLGVPLVSALVAAGQQVTSFDRFSREPVRQLPDGATRFAGDFLDKGDLARALAGKKEVFHFLSMTTPVASDDDPFLDLRTNVFHTVELLKLCVDAGVERLYFASSGGTVYGDQGKAALSENDLAEPISPYGIGKLAIENYLSYFHAKYGLESVILRISNPYGPGQPPTRRQGLIPIVLGRVAEGLPVVRSGAGTMVRDYLYVDDAIAMILALVGGEPRHRVYNIGSGVGHSVNQVFEAIQRVTGRTLDVQDVPKPASFVEHVVLDTSRFAGEFGALEPLSLDEGIARTWAALRS